jgi:hypothetical protein
MVNDLRRSGVVVRWKELPLKFYLSVFRPRALTDVLVSQSELRCNEGYLPGPDRSI